ncbi:response regulator [bacterium]|nr:response regulator [bacterium]
MMRRLAIIDDDTIFQFTTKVKIEKLNLADEIKIFGDGEQIFQYLNETILADLPSILLLDINMPIADGWDFLEMYESLDADKKENMKIYMLSSSINPVDVEKADAHPRITKYITKPIQDQVLQEILAF